MRPDPSRFISKMMEYAVFGASPRWTMGLINVIPEEKILPFAQTASFKTTVRYAYQRSRFYQRLFDKHGIDVNRLKRPEDLGEVFTEGEDLRQNPYEDFLCDKPHTVYETTGTTSPIPKRVFFSQTEVQLASKVGGTGLWKIGLRPDDRVASAFDYSFWISGPTLKASLGWLGAFHVEAGKIDPKDFYDRIEAYRCSVLVGDPSWLLRLSEVAEKKGPWPLKMILAGGENMTERTRQYIESIWDTDVLLTYGQTEGFGMLGSECRQKNGYHVNDYLFAFEIINRDADGYGEIVYTTLSRRCMPLIRYRSGDVSKLIHEYCPCGLGTTKIAKLKGRVDEMISCGMGNISPWMFEQILKRSSLVSEDWQIAVIRPANKDVLEFRIELQDLDGRRKTVEQGVLGELKTHFPEYWASYQMGLFEIQFRFFEAGKLRTSRKLKHLVDERSELIRGQVSRLDPFIK